MTDTTIDIKQREKIVEALGKARNFVRNINCYVSETKEAKKYKDLNQFIETWCEPDTEKTIRDALEILGIFY